MSPRRNRLLRNNRFPILRIITANIVKACADNDARFLFFQCGKNTRTDTVLKIKQNKKAKQRKVSALLFSFNNVLFKNRLRVALACYAYPAVSGVYGKLIAVSVCKFKAAFC